MWLHLLYGIYNDSVKLCKSDKNKEINKKTQKQIHSHTYIKIHAYIYIYMCGEGGGCVQLLGGQGARAHVIHVLRECIWNAPAFSLVLPAFENTGSLGSPLRQRDYPPV